jgi:hypothetical protein
VVVVEPVLTIKTLNHELINLLIRVWFLAVAVAVEVSLVIPVLIIIVLFVVKRTRKGQSTVATVTPEVHLVIQLMNLVSFVAVDHTPQADAMRLDELL